MSERKVILVTGVRGYWGAQVAARLIAKVDAQETPAYHVIGLDSEPPAEEIKGLDEQVQEIKADALSIAAELSQLEEMLLFPSNTQVAVFVSLASEEKFRLDTIEVSLDGAPAARHIYSFKELEALQKGGVQRLYTGNISMGDHEMRVITFGKTSSGFESNNSKQFKVQKGIGPKIVEIRLTPQDIDIKEN